VNSSQRAQLEVLVERAWERVAKRRGPWLWPETPRSVVVNGRADLVASLVRDVARGQYAVGPVSRNLVHGDPPRVIHRFGFLDSVLALAVGSWLTRMLEPSYADDLYSYRTARSNVMAVSRIAGFLRAHRRAKPSPRDRDLFVFRGDVTRYTDSIPVGEDALLWDMLRERLSPDGPPFELVAALARPSMSDSRARPTVGLPTGTAILPPLANLYLGPLDRALGALGGLYSRYGDDILFAHEDVAIFCEAETLRDRWLTDLGLRINDTKARRLVLRSSGAPDATRHFLGAQSVIFLGFAITHEGTIAPAPRKARALLRRIRERLEVSSRLLALDQKPAGRLVPTLCGIVRSLFDPSHPGADPLAVALLRIVTCRKSLEVLDHAIARCVAEVAERHSPGRSDTTTRRTGARAFRTFPPKDLRAAGLPSLVQARNRVGRSKR
jgi:hypothetical protein